MTKLEALPSYTDSNPEYTEYRQSERWAMLRRAVMLRARGRCQICRRRPGAELAHLTYDHIFQEQMEDLLWLCRPCHRELDEERRQRRAAALAPG
jgi:5-methylcytosine-specific restriction endonuclease McrA